MSSENAAHRSKAWADEIIANIRRVRGAAAPGASAAVSTGDAARVIAALIAALDAKDPNAIRLARKLADVNSVYSKRAA